MSSFNQSKLIGPFSAERPVVVTMSSGFDLSKIPSPAPPPGVTPNFENPYSLAVLPRGFIYATLPPMVLFLGLRFYTRIKISRQVGIDDCELACNLLRIPRTSTYTVIQIFVLPRR